jgi:hypothetical protein
VVDVVFRDVPVEMLAKIAEVLAPIQPEVISGPEWTPEAAAALIADVPSRARDLIHKLIVNNGYVSAAQMRGDGDDTLRGLTGPITKAMGRLVKAGKLPDGLPNPVETRYDPDVRAYQKAIAFEMPREIRLAFTAGWKRRTWGAGQ